MIANTELRELFDAECTEHLQELETQLLVLDKSPANQPALDEAFRRAHSLKGASNMVGVKNVEIVAHHFEDTLAAARNHTITLSAETIDRMVRALDAIRQLASEAVTGVSSGVDVGTVLEQLLGNLRPGPASAGKGAPITPGPGEAEVMRTASWPNGHPPSTPRRAVSLEPQPPTTGAAKATAVPGDAFADFFAATPSAASAVTLDAAEIAPVTSRATATTGGAAPFMINTVRVKPRQLDALMTLAGEMTVTKIQMGSWVNDLEELGALWEESHRGTPARREERREQSKARLQRLLGKFHEGQARLEYVTTELVENIRSVRLLPLKTIFQLFPRMVRDLAQVQKKEVQFLVEGGDIAADKRILEGIKDPLMHLLRNAMDHGLERPDEREHTGKPRLATLRLRASQTHAAIVIEISDDGRGLNLEAIRRTALKNKLHRADELAAMSVEQVQALIFAPGFSTAEMVTDVSGRGVGLDVVRATVEHLKGTIQLESEPGRGCLFRLQLPATLTTARVLIVEVNQRPYALPVEFVEVSRLLVPTDFFTLEGRQTVLLDGQPVTVVHLADLLELPAPTATVETDACARPSSCVFLTFGKERIGLIVDGLVTEQEVLFRPFGAILRRVRNVSSATILGSGEVCMILHAPDLLRSVRKRKHAIAAPVTSEVKIVRKPLILLAEDSMTTRLQEKRILEAAGYEVVTAVDGVDAFTKLAAQAFDAVVSDVEMPNLDGLGLTAQIRKDKKFSELPILLVTSLATEAHQRAGVEAGANAYLTKPSFDQKVFLDTLKRLI